MCAECLWQGPVSSDDAMQHRRPVKERKRSSGHSPLKYQQIAIRVQYATALNRRHRGDDRKRALEVLTKEVEIGRSDWTLPLILYCRWSARSATVCRTTHVWSGACSRTCTSSLDFRLGCTWDIILEYLNNIAGSKCVGAGHSLVPSGV